MNYAAWGFVRRPKTYCGLVALHLPRPIHDKVACDNAVEIVHAIPGHKLNRDQDDGLAPRPSSARTTNAKMSRSRNRSRAARR